MHKYTTLQYFKRQGYFDIVVAYNVAPGRFRERTEIRVPEQFIQEGRIGRYISKSFPEYLSSVEKINLLQANVEKIVEDYVLKNNHKPDSNWVRAAYDLLQSDEMKRTVVVGQATEPQAPFPTPAETRNVGSVSHPGSAPLQHGRASTVQSSPYPTHTLAAKLVRGLGTMETNPVTAYYGNPITSTQQARQSETAEVVGDLFRFWAEFMADRKLVRRDDATFNELVSLRSTLEAFAVRKNRTLSFGRLDQAFFVDLVYFLINEHEHQVNAFTLPVIGLHNETAMRRLRDLKTYVDYCVAENYLSLNKSRMDRYMLVARRKYGVKKLSDPQNWELTFCKEELEFVVNLDQYEPEFYTSLSPTKKRYLDIMIFMCLQGTAPIDTMKLERPDIQNGLILKDRSKTDTAFKVEVDPISMVILERNNYCLDFNDTTFNRAIKGIFVTVFELFKIRFGEAYERIYKRPYALVEKQMRKKGRTAVYEIKHKGLFVEAMTGRRTFLTIVAGRTNEFGIKMAMEMAGHTKPSTTLGYMHPTTPAGESLLGVERIQNQAS